MKKGRARMPLPDYNNSGYGDEDGDGEDPDGGEDDDEDDDDGEGGMMAAGVTKKLRRTSGDGQVDGFATYGMGGGLTSKAGPSGQYGKTDSSTFSYFLPFGHSFL